MPAFSILPRLRRLNSKLLPALFLFVAVGAAAKIGAFVDLDRGVRNLGFAVRDSAASGQLHVVEMDAASVAAIQRWPWPRSQYARVVDALDRAGARSIVFDVDFSSPSEPAQDEAFARSLENASAVVVLPTFGQSATHGSKRQIDALPIPSLRRHASLASVSVIPDPDGLVRHMPFGTVTEGTPRPSLSAQIAGAGGEVGAQFPIDYATDPKSIPRHSFVAVANGRFDAGSVRGKDVLIGATAIEMGDRYATPRHGVIPGVIVQALAGETLLDGVPHYGGALLPLFLAMLVTIVTSGLKNYFRIALVCSLAAIGTFGFFVAAWALFRIDFQIVPALSLILIGAIYRSAMILRGSIHARRRSDADSGLPNGLALREVDAPEAGFTVAALIVNYDAIKSVIGDDHVGLLVSRVAERLASSDGMGRLYRIDDRVLAWVCGDDPQEQLDRLPNLQRVLRKPLEIAGRQIDLSVVFGLAKAGSVTEATLAASTALENGEAWHIHEEAERIAAETQISLMGELDAAIEGDELEVHYQPKLDLSKNEVVSVEALVRWQHPTRGHLSPDTFIPLTEKTDRIADLTLFVLRRTLADLAGWQALGLDLRAAVNISARLVSSKSFYTEVEQLLASSPVAATSIIFEVTESAAMSDPQAAIAALEGFRDMGIAISIDDYGTGQSTLNYLKVLPISELKIDRYFVEHVHEDNNDALLVRSTVQLAHSLGLRVVAEGIENAECLAFLRSIECDLAQGYFVSKPVLAKAIPGVCNSLAAKMGKGLERAA